MLRLFLRNTAAGYLLKVLQMVLGLVAIPVLVGRVGAEGYGLIVLAGTLLGYFSVFDLGMSNAITKFVAQYEATGDRDEVDRVIATSLATFAVIGATLAAAVLVAIGLGALDVFNIPETLRDEARSIFTLTAFLSLFAWPRLALKGALRGLQAFVPLNIVTGLGRVVAVSLAIAFAWADFPLTAVYLAMQIDIFVSLAFLPMLLRQRLPGWAPRLGQVSRATLAVIWSFSAWLMLSKIAVLLEYQLDTLILGIALPLSAITAYTVLTYPFRMLQQLSGLAAAAAMPAVSALASARNETALELFRLKGARLHNGFLAIVTVTLLLLLGPFLRLWMGEAFLDQIWIAYFATGFQFIWQSNAFVGQVYTGLGLARKPGIVAIITGVLNLILSLALVQVFGVAGVILGTVLAGVCGVLLFVLWCLPDIGITPRHYVRDILLRGQGPVWLAGLALFGCLRMSGIAIEGWGGLLAAATLISAGLTAVAFRFVLDREDRAFVREKLRRQT